MTSLRAFQEEIKNLVFFQSAEKNESALWAGPIPSRLNVYRNNTRTNWTDTLDHDFALTRKQFSEPEWNILRQQFFIKHPPAHWELNESMIPFTRFLKTQKIKPWIRELADYEWSDLKVFIDRSTVKRGSGVSNPTALVRAYQHQIFYWVDAKAPPSKPPMQKPEVLVFYRDSKNTVHICEADPLMILLLDHFKKPGALLQDLEPIRRKLLPGNSVPLTTVLSTLHDADLIL